MPRLAIALTIALALLACDPLPEPVDGCAPADGPSSSSGTETSTDAGESQTGTEGNAGYCCRCDLDVCEWADFEGQCAAAPPIGWWVLDCSACSPTCGG